MVGTLGEQPAPSSPQAAATDAAADNLDTLVDSSDSDSEDECSIFEAIKRGKHSTAVHKVRRGGLDLEETEPGTGWTPLLVTAYYGSERAAAALCKAGCNVHATSTSGETALHLACKWPHEKVVEVLLKHGANPNALNKRARSPAHTSCQFGRRGNLELIIGAGGDVSLQDLDGNTPLHLAVRSSGPGPNEVVRMLLRSKCRLDLPNKAGELPLHNVHNTQALVVFAAMEGLPDLMTALIKKGGVKLDVFDNSGMSPLQTAAFKGDVAVARALVAGGAKVNFQASPSWSPCPSLSAADSLLVGHAPSGHVKPLGDRSPLHFAAERGILPMMELLLAHGAKVNNTSNEGLISPLHIAVWNQQAEAVRVLLAHKADVKARVNKNGMAPLHFACNARNAKLEIISMLLDAKADIEERCSDGLTPLMLAAQMATPDAVRLLLVRGARVQAKGRRGMTAVDCAEGRADILSVLAQHCAARGLTEMASKATAAAQRAARMAAKAAAMATPALTMGEPNGAPASSAAGGSHGPLALPAPPSSSTGAGASGSSNGSSSSTSFLLDGSGASGGLLSQLKQQLSSTSSQLYAWANQRAGAGAGAPGSSSAGMPGDLGDGNNSTLQQLLGHMGLPTSLADIGSSPLNSPGSGSGGLGSLPLLEGAGGGSGGAMGSPPNMNALSEAVQMLSCITAIVTNQQADALAAAGGASSSGRAGGNASSSNGSIRRNDGKAVSRKRSAAASSSNGTAAAAIDGTNATTPGSSDSGPAAGSGAPSSSTAAAPAAASTSTPAAAAPAAPPAPPAPAGVCTLQQPKWLPRSLRACSCSVAPADGVVQANEHHLSLTCTSGCKLCFHLPCWKAVREQLRVARPGFPATFTQVQEPIECIGKDCQGTLQQVCMVGPAGTQVLYQPPPKPSTTIKAELVLRPAPLSATVPLTPVSTVSYTFVAEKPPSPPPAPAPVVLLPPSEGGPAPPGLVATSAALTAPRSDSPPVPAAAGDAAAAAADAHLMRRKRRGPREPAAPPMGPESGEALQGRNPPVPVNAEHHPAPSADPLAFMRVGAPAAAPSAAAAAAPVPVLSLDEAEGNGTSNGQQQQQGALKAHALAEAVQQQAAQNDGSKIGVAPLMQ